MRQADKRLVIDVALEACSPLSGLYDTADQSASSMECRADLPLQNAIPARSENAACQNVTRQRLESHTTKNGIRSVGRVYADSVSTLGRESEQTIGPVNVVTVDVEDWPQSSVDADFPMTDRFVRNTQAVMELLASHGVRGTFFILGLAAEYAPRLVGEIQAAGHEVQSHGYGHRAVRTQSREAFRADADRSKKLLEDLTGRRINAFRAPAFGITNETFWALEVLREVGFDIDSSVFPLQTRRYGIKGACRFPHLIDTGAGTVVECPVASWRWCGREWPTGGGGYARLLPSEVIGQGIRQLNRAGHPAVLYLHPHELDPEETRETSFPISRLRRWHQGLGRSLTSGRWARLLGRFAFSRLDEMLARNPRIPCFPYSALDRTGNPSSTS